MKTVGNENGRSLTGVTRLTMMRFLAHYNCGPIFVALTSHYDFDHCVEAKRPMVNVVPLLHDIIAHSSIHKTLSLSI